MTQKNNKKIKKIGIECHNLEGKRFGVGQTLIQLLEEISRNPRMAEKFEFYLYFKKEIPEDKVLNSPIFRKKILRAPYLPASFAVFYNILIPLEYFAEKLDGFFFPGYMLPAFFRGKSIVVMTNDVYYETRKGTLPLRYRAAYGIFSNLAAKRATRIMTISESAKKEIAEYYGIALEKISVNPWGLNRKLLETSFDPKNAEQVKKELGIKKDFILSWGQAFPRRHYREAILAFERIAPKFPDLQYVLIATDKYNPPVLESLAKEVNKNLGREAIIHRNYMENEDNLFSLVKSARLVFYASSSEAMGLPPLEALSLGTPSLVTDNDLNREFLGDNAFKVKKPDNIDAIATKMILALSDENFREMIAKNGPNIAKKFSWASSLNNLVKIFDEIF